MAFQDLIVPLAISGGVASAITLSIWKLLTHYFVPVPPNRALVLYGGRSNPVREAGSDAGRTVELREPRIIVGGGAYLPPWRRGSGFLSLEPLDTDVVVSVGAGDRGSAAPGWEARIALQVKIPAEPRMLRTAAENLLGKNEEEIRRLARRAVEGAAPPILAALPRDPTEMNWDHVAADIQASAARELVAAGLVIRSLSLTQLHRTAGPETSPPARPSAPESPPGLGWEDAPSVRLGTLEARLDRAERNVGNLGAELVRVVREGSLFSEPPVILPHDSMGGDIPSSDSAPRATAGAGGRAGRARAPLDAPK